MKIAVYTIALNEEKHVKQWYESARDADLIVIADTGSTDKTRYLAKSLGISVTEIEVKPWRFDVARNASLALIPEDFDICIQLDMDEVLPEGWRKKVEEAFIQGNTWPIYKHVTSRDSEGKPRNFQHYFKIHPRMGFFWKYPIHEVLTHLPELSFDRKIIDLEVDHIKDPTKSRNSYLSLLETAVEEDPIDWRMNHYLNREYFYNKDWLKVLQSTYRCETINGGWDVERASTYMWASEAAHHLKMTSLAEDWARKATETASHFYEVWHWRAHIAHLNGKWSECLDFASKRMTLERQNHHLVKPEIWEWWGYDLLALSSNKLGKGEDAVVYGELAILGNPQNQRLKKNLGFYLEARNTERANVPKSYPVENLKFFYENFSLSEKIQVMDVGAAAIAETPSYLKLVTAGSAHIHAFEGDARQLQGMRKAFGSNVSIYQEFLFDGNQASLYLATPASGMTSLFKPNPSALNFFNGFQEFGRIEEVRKVKTTRLDDILELPLLDFIKMDIQGAELTVLKNGINKILNCLAIQLEVSWIPLYEGQPSFGEVDMWMRAQGFVPHSLVDVKRWSITPTIFKGNFRSPGNQLLESDILYIRNPHYYHSLTESQLTKLIWIAHHCFQSYDLCVFAMLELISRGKLDRHVQFDYSEAIKNLSLKF